MSVVVVGLDHRRVPLDVLERVAINADRSDHALDLLLKSDHLTEAVVVSTCMRTEIYVEAIRFHGAVGHVRSVLAQLSDLEPDQFVGSLYELHEEAAYAHLFRVAAGLESAVVGESEILGQIARSWEAARLHGACRSVLGSLFRHAVGVGKRARTETAIARGITSIGQAAVVMATDRLGGLDDTSVLVVGAGDMADRMAVALSATKGIGNVVVCNRTPERGAALAARIGGVSTPWSELGSALRDADLVLSSTGSPGVVFDVAMVEGAMRARTGRPLVMVDVAVPRDVDVRIAELDDVAVLDMDDLRSFADVGRAERAGEVGHVAAIVQEETAVFTADISARVVTPLVKAMREHVEIIRKNEIERHRRRLDDLDDERREVVESMTKAMMSKLMHEPTVRLKEAAGTPDGERMAEAFRLLFGL